MDYLSQYAVSFSGLNEGKHLFGFSADKRFFAVFGESDIEEGTVNIQVELEKRSTHLRLTFIHEGEVGLICDRCLDTYSQPVKGRNIILVKFSEDEIDDGDEVVYIHPGSHQVEVAKLIYEFIVLSIPIRHVHPDDQDGKSLCDPEMLKKLEEHKAATVQQEIDPIDPRWGNLKNFIGN